LYSEGRPGIAPIRLPVEVSLLGGLDSVIDHVEFCVAYLRIPRTLPSFRHVDRIAGADLQGRTVGGGQSDFP
jgi:hypothetical protein